MVLATCGYTVTLVVNSCRHVIGIAEASQDFFLPLWHHMTLTFGSVVIVTKTK
jgi:hypothetical protein